MNKNEFLKKLDILLESLPYDERRDIMYDYEEHFKSGLYDGKSEEQIADELGNPETIAASYIPNMHTYNRGETREKDIKNVQYINNRVTYNIPILIGMIFFNLMFIGVYLALWAVLISLFVVGIALIISSIAILIVSVVGTSLSFVSIPYYIIAHPILGFLVFIFVASVGGLIIVGTSVTLKLYKDFTMKYIEWNKKIIRSDNYYEKA
ncbi:membrane protein [Vallitalea longa]|uniref:Membrane protein n=1 Tax=Vallitalea longa TaxID=2936439 RepID=A0A9W6DG25_9FIRM|nr:DUF1700 domain-containing protein [Vallitalea longa]GKX31861.1 membrane protein [Vallitalea longa]